MSGRAGAARNQDGAEHEDAEEQARDERRQQDDEAQETEGEQHESPDATMQQHAMRQEVGPEAAPQQHPAEEKAEEAKPATEAPERSESEPAAEPATAEAASDVKAEPVAADKPAAEAGAESEAAAAQPELEAEAPDTADAALAQASEGGDVATGGEVACADGAAEANAPAGGAVEASGDAAAAPPLEQASKEAAAPEAVAEPAAKAAPPRRSPPRASAAAVADAQGEIEEAVVAERGEIAARFAAQRAETEATTLTQEVVGLTGGVTHHAQILADLTQRESVARGLFAATRANLAIVSITQGELARNDARQAIQMLRDDDARQRQAARDAAETQGKRTADAGKAQGRRIVTSARSTIDAVKGHAEDAIASADHIEDQGDRDAAKAALRKAKNDTKDRLLDQCLSDHDNLVDIGKRNHGRLGEAAIKLFKDKDKEQPKLEAEITSMGGQLAFRFQLLLKSQLASVDKAEREYLANLGRLKQQAAQVVTAGVQASKLIRARGKMQVTTLHVREGVAISQVERAGQAAQSELGKHDELPRSQASAFAAKARTALGEARQQHLAAADGQHAQEHAQLAGAGARFGERVGDKAGELGSTLDGALGAVSTALTETTNTMIAQCSVERSLALAAYTSTFAQVATDSWAKVDEARADWTAKADEFETTATSRANGQIANHAQLVAAMPAKLEGITKETVKNRHKSWIRRKLENAWKHFKSFAWGLLVLIAVVGLSFLVGFWVLVVFLGYMVAMAVISRFKTLFAAWDDWSTLGKIAGVVGTVFAAVGDVFGVTYFFEGIFESEAVTGRDLSDEEASERFWIGLYSIALLFAIKGATKYVRGRKPPTPRGELPPGETANKPPATETPATEKPATEAPAAEKPVTEGPATEKPATEKPAGETEAVPPSRELGLRPETIEALETLENIKKNPLGEINRQPNHNHYKAARREAAGEVVARKANGRPFDHIRDLQEHYNALDNVRHALEIEMRTPAETATPRGIDVLLKKHSEVQSLLSRLKGFLESIDNGPPFPPFHEWPPGS